MRLRHNLILLKLLFDRNITRTPQRVFRELKQRGRLNATGTRAALSKNVWGRLQSLRYILRWLDGEHLTRFEDQWIINSFLPPFPGRAYDRMFENLLSGRRWSPVSAFLAITSDCPANCWHCSLKRRKGGNLPTETWRRVIGELHELGVSLFGITGGEPLVRDDLCELIAEIKTGGGEVMMFTSGIGMTAERAAALKNAGLWAVCVSMDRNDHGEVDQMRCFPGALDQAQKTLQLANAAGLYTCVNCVADQKNVRSKTYLSLYEKSVELGVDEFRLIEPMPCGQLLDADDSVFLTPPQITELRRFHRETNRNLRYGSKHQTKVCAFNEIESPELFGCSGGTRHLFIDAAGEVCPCDFTPLSFGNVTEESMATIRDRMSTAMKQPRRHCIIQNHHELIQLYTKDRVPAPVEASLEAVAALPEEPLPDFVQWAEQGSLR